MHVLSHQGVWTVLFINTVNLQSCSHVFIHHNNSDKMAACTNSSAFPGLSSLDVSCRDCWGFYMISLNAIAKKVSSQNNTFPLYTTRRGQKPHPERRPHFLHLQPRLYSAPCVRGVQSQGVWATGRDATLGADQ